MSQDGFGRAVFAAPGVLMLWAVIRSLRTGRFPLSLIDCERDERPVMFWWSVIASFVIGAINIFLALFGQAGGNISN